MFGGISFQNVPLHGGVKRFRNDATNLSDVYQICKSLSDELLEVGDELLMEG